MDINIGDNHAFEPHRSIKGLWWYITCVIGLIWAIVLGNRGTRCCGQGYMFNVVIKYILLGWHGNLHISVQRIVCMVL